MVGCETVGQSEMVANLCIFLSNLGNLDACCRLASHAGAGGPFRLSSIAESNFDKLTAKLVLLGRTTKMAPAEGTGGGESSRSGWRAKRRRSKGSSARSGTRGRPLGSRRGRKAEVRAGSLGWLLLVR